MLPIILLLGPRGCGKGTLAGRLTTSYNIHHLSVGDWLREQTKFPISNVPSYINNFIARNSNIPKQSLISEYGQDWMDHAPPALILYVCSTANVSTPNSMWIRAMPALKHECEMLSKSHGKQSPKAILLDNFPKTLAQSNALDAHFGSHNTPILANSLTCQAGIILQRFLARSRGKDNAVTFERRLQRFEKESPAVIEKYRVAGKLVEIDVAGTPEVVHHKVVSMLERNPTWSSLC